MKVLATIILIFLVFFFAVVLSTQDTIRPCGNRYIVAEGDTLESVATRCGVSPAAIMAENPQIIDPGHLQVGMVLRIPAEEIQTTLPAIELAPATGQGGVPPAPQPTSPPPQEGVIPVTGEQQSAAPASGGTSLYTVQECDTLAGIASSYGTTVQAIVAINPAISDPDLIYVGQQIAVPAQ